MPRTQMIALSSLPETVTRYLAAHSVHDTAAQLVLFAADATVVDDGSTCEGIEAIADWMGRSAAEYRYAVRPIAAERADDRHYTVVQHLEGDFPGGAVDLNFRFALRGGLIESLVIEP
ncbi:hypothetical protein GCM10018793_09790 [Streptomyces sulfonofaciens]|uniref:SnoaL-like domain-containing protein n=1 Tax=Streptomyces sulfonofaciens TaxID=68272 RepID=A0A919FU97_9ACTN|nr:nuclear transport factor 2 family protein [Streptomyces sulfonofaciens]GHH72557.1 hypothetical protein GCM10018793_09790 [Streptomyces sulfonofaciens]